MDPVDTFELVLALLAIAVVLALVARRLGIPPAAAYVVGGMVLAVIPGAPALAMDPGLIMALFLPPLLQGSAFTTVWRDFRANLRPILLLAVGAVVFSTFVAGVVLKLLAPGLPWGPCFVFGAIVSPPDAVSAAAILERLRLPRRLVTVLLGESLVNDASGLVLYRVFIAATAAGTYQMGSVTLSFLPVALGGVAIGLACGRVVGWMFRRLNHTHLEIVVSFLVSWVSYLVAEAVGASGVLSTVACGLLMGWYQHETFSSRTRMEAAATWRFATFVLEALVFILIGLSLHGVLVRLPDWGVLWRLLPVTAGVSAAIIIARFVWVIPATYLPRLLWPPLARRDPSPPFSYAVVLGWAGMRGVVSMAAALALPEGFPGRDQILFLTFAVILVTVLVQGCTLGPLIKRLGLEETPAAGAIPPEARARSGVEAAMLGLMQERAADPLIGAIAQDLLGEYRDRAGWADRTRKGGGAVMAERTARLSLRLEALAAGRAALLRLHRGGEIHDSELATLEQELDLEELRLRGQIGEAD